MNKVNIISLGCSKNLVDSELLLKQLDKAGYQVEADVENSRAEIVIINTCGFIGDAKEESVNTILEQVERKKEGQLSCLLVMGCLSQRYMEELKREIPEVDGWFGKFDWQGILQLLGKPYNEAIRTERLLTTPAHYAYLKISEGCNRSCSYCAIPLMTGEHQSRDFDEIIREAEQLSEKGVRELLVVAQDTTYYGIDKYGRNRLAELVERLAAVPGIHWIKLHYAYPAGFPMELLRVMREHINVCNYLDIALQHCTDHMLQVMRRGITAEQTRRLIRQIREEVPGIVLRTTLMAGHPGETEEDFREMLDFVQEMRFERLGVFPYSHEEDTYCDIHYSDDIPEEVKQSRAEAVMDLQRDISAAFNASRIGEEIEVVIDRQEKEYYVGRTAQDSPDVDPEVLIFSDRQLMIGSFYHVTITDSDEYDIYARCL